MQRLQASLSLSLSLRLRNISSDPFSGRKIVSLLHANWIMQVWSCMQVPSSSACITWNWSTYNWTCCFWIYGFNSCALLRSALHRWTSCMVLTESAIYSWHAFARSGVLHACCHFSFPSRCHHTGLEHLHGQCIVHCCLSSSALIRTLW